VKKKARKAQKRYNDYMQSKQGKKIKKKIKKQREAHPFETRATIAHEETDAQLLERLGTDGMKWAEEFVRRVRKQPGLCGSKPAMHGWFTNAIEQGRQAGRQALIYPEHEEGLRLTLNSLPTDLVSSLTELMDRFGPETVQKAVRVMIGINAQN
jgi:hypothetical protein